MSWCGDIRMAVVSRVDPKSGRTGKLPLSASSRPPPFARLLVQRLPRHSQRDEHSNNQPESFLQKPSSVANELQTGGHRGTIAGMAAKADNWLPTRRSLLQRLKRWDDQESWRDFFDTYS